MKKRMLSLIMAVTSVAMFGVLYPEYILLSDTYEYILEENLQDLENPWNSNGNADLSALLYAGPEQIQVSSKLLQYLAEEGIIEWKN